jgi:zinc protease
MRSGGLASVLFVGQSLLFSAGVASARERPPAALPPRPTALLVPSVQVLGNGLKVLVVERHSLPLLTLRLEVRAGAEADPPNRPGTAQMVAGLLDEGTTRRSARQIAEAIDQVGGTIETGAEWDDSFAEASVLTDHTELAFDLLSDIAIHPAFAPAEVERHRRQMLSALDVVRGDPSYLADAAFRRVLFTGTPYSHPEDGSKEPVEHLTPESLREFHARYYQPARSILAVVGDISSQEAFDRAERYFGAWAGQAASSAASSAPAQPASRQVVVIDKPDAVQTEIRIGNLGIPRASADYYALSVANQILGGPAANRLFRALRSRDGLTYGASSDLLCYRSLGGWVAKTFTRTPETIKSVHVALQQMKRLREHPITEDELETAKGYLIGHQALDFETSEGIAGQVLDLMLHDLPLDYWNRFPERIQALRAEDVWDATRRYLDPEDNVIVLVGNAAGFKKDLKELGPSRVIPVSRVDFATDSLERAGSPGHE